MEKKDITLRQPKNKSLELHGNEIEFTPFITMADRYLLVREFVSTLFETDDIVRQYHVAKNALILGVIDVVSNINVENLSVDSAISSGLWKRIRQDLENYDELEEEIETVVKYVRENKYGMDFSHIKEQVSTLLDRILSVDLSKEGITELFGKLDQSVDEINRYVDPSKVKEEKPRRKTKAG